MYVLINIKSLIQHIDDYSEALNNMYMCVVCDFQVEANYRILMDIYASFSACGIPPLMMWKDSR